TSLQPPVADSPAVLAMARRSQLEGRVMAILENGVNRKGVSQAGILAAMLVMVLVWPLAAARPALPPQEQQPVRVGSGIQPPMKVKDVRPAYPPAAMAEGRQGIAIIEAVIGTDGTVRDATIIRSIGDDLDRAALDAVYQWVFRPTTLNGQPVPVIMTVTVNFRLADDGQIPPPPPPPPVPPPAGDVPPPPPPPDPPLPPVTWSPGDAPLRIGGQIKEPKKIKDVRPVYPPEAQDARVTGIVILEILIDEEGMVSEARVIRPVALLDEAARDAVLQWQFMPTLINGQPVPVIMTVTVNFTLGAPR
ncbi:MAG: energy transducer TonB, partial [Acidobacteria bacterium]|nr:energy transducer TonB [Acidobacteriota bacterium]